MSKIYQNGVVAFIDLLGFKEAVKVEKNAPEILHILQQIKNGENSSHKADIEKSRTTATIKLKPAISAASDSLAITIPESLFNETISWRHAVIEILNITQQLANFLIGKGFLIRGGLTVGKVYHENNIIFGPGHVSAYELESKVAKYPRIVASQELVDLFNADKNGGTQECFIKDDDGHYHLDYLPIALQYFARGECYHKIIQEKILHLMKTSSSDQRALRILEKWMWFEKYHQMTVDRIGC